ncbi:MAG: hypothetical protein ACKOQ8_06185 [Micrococcales bacterium]
MAEYIMFNRLDGLHTDHQRRIAQIVRDYDPTLRLMLLEGTHPNYNPEKPFAVVCEPPITTPYVVFNLAESEIDHRVLARIIEGDMTKAGSTVNRLELLEMAERVTRAKAEADYEEEKKDLLRSMLKSGKHSYRHGGKTLRK